MNRLRNERGYTLVEVLATLAIAAVIFSVITLALHTLRADVTTSNQDTDNDRHIAKATAILDRIFTNATQVRAISNAQVNVQVYEKNSSGTMVTVYKSLYYENGSLLICPIAAITDVLNSACSTPAKITDRLYSRPVYTSTVFPSGGVRSGVTLSSTGAAATVAELKNGQLIDVTLPFSFVTGVGSGTVNKTVSLHLKLSRDGS